MPGKLRKRVEEKKACRIDVAGTRMRIWDATLSRKLGGKLEKKGGGLMSRSVAKKGKDGWC